MNLFSGDTAMFHRPTQKPTHISRHEISEARFKQFVRELNTYERKVSFDDNLNTFLDLYSQWMKTHEPALKMRVVMLAFELHRLNPAFECDLAFTD